MITRLRPDLIADVQATDGEGPFWIAAERRLGWVDIGAGLFHRLDPASGRDETIDTGSPLGAAAARRDGGFVLALRDGFALLDPGASEPRMVAPIDGGGLLRFNDGKVDAAGRFWAGNMAYALTPEAGTLYRLDPDLSVTPALTGLTLSNGLDWTADARSFYLIDSLAAGVDVFDFDLAAGTLANRRRAFEVPDLPGGETGQTLPDGMTLDAAGELWVAVWGSGEVRRYTPEGEITAVVEMPVACPSSCAFGGEDLLDLYITSLVPVGGARRPGAGAVYRCRPDVGGLPANLFAG